MTTLSHNPVEAASMPPTQTRTPIPTLVLIWIAWAAILLGYQTLVSERVEPVRPDYTRSWTADFTRENAEFGVYLSEPFMERQVAYDSEYYLSIAVVGYDDFLNAPSVRTPRGQRISLNNAFFPFYPAVMGALSLPLRVLGLNPIATATLAGVIVSLVGSLVGMISLYTIARPHLDNSGGLRAAFYLLVFPTGFYLATVYTEGLFVGLAFASLALIQYKRLLGAGILAALATWTRSIGIALVIPLALAWLSLIDWRALRRDPLSALRPYLPLIIRTLAVVLPVIAYLLWRAVFGANFDYVQDNFFGRRVLDIQFTLESWGRAFEGFLEGQNPSARVYFMIEAGAVILAFVACLFTLRRYPGIALFSAAALIIPVFSGDPQSLVRYILVIPSVYLFLARLGKSAAFDRAWTIASLVLFALLTFLFTYDFWVA